MGKVVAKVATEEIRLDTGPHAASSAVRTRAMLRLEDGRGNFGVGEAAPLPGYSPDRIGEVLGFFEKRPWEALDRIDDGDARMALEELAYEIRGAPASGRFAMETAALDLWARRRTQPVWRLLAEIAPPVLPVAEVVTTVAEVDAAVARALSVPTLKIKVGADWTNDRTFVTEVRRRVPTARLRLDCNQRLRRDQMARLQALAIVEPEFIEEPWPLLDGDGWEDAPCPLALDESLQIPGAAEAFVSSLSERDHPFSFVVLKPTALGGVHRTLELVALGAHAGLRPILSHTLEGPTARAMLVHLAFASMDGDTAAGLGPGPGEPPIPGAVLRRPDQPGLGEEG